MPEVVSGHPFVFEHGFPLIPKAFGTGMTDSGACFRVNDLHPETKKGGDSIATPSC
jgi:hypothetical protein